jgi:hypothetical protein
VARIATEVITRHALPIIVAHTLDVIFSFSLFPFFLDICGWRRRIGLIIVVGYFRLSLPTGRKL